MSEDAHKTNNPGNTKCPHARPTDDILLTGGALRELAQAQIFLQQIEAIWKDAWNMRSLSAGYSGEGVLALRETRWHQFKEERLPQIIDNLKS